MALSPLLCRSGARATFSNEFSPVASFCLRFSSRSGLKVGSCRGALIHLCTLLDWRSKQLGLFLLHRLTSGSQRGGAKAGSHFLNNFLSKVHRCIVCIIGDFAIGRFATARFAVSRGCAILSHASACNCTCTGAGNQVLLLAALSERCCP